MSDNEFWIRACAIFGLVVCTLMSLITIYWAHQNNKIAEMVNSGTNPVAAKCAMQDDYGRMPVCLVLAAKK